MDAPSSNAHEFSVSELALAVKRAVEDEFGYVRVRGEISGYRGPHSSGHAYFTLKDDAASIDAVVWKTSMFRLKFKPEEGMEVIATGRLTTFPKSSKYQIVIEQLEPAGAGALMALLEERRRKLAAEGLFAAERKQKLPYLPRVIGVVTSPTGAVIRDILHRLNDRFPTRVLVWPVRVQGDTAAMEVANAVRGFNALAEGGPVPRPDLLIVARGGGSIEDLWSFNEEIVVRAVAESRIPVISGVGHETDTTLIDYAADLRAPTPTAAAEAAVPVRAELIAYVDDQGARTRNVVRRHLLGSRDRLRAAAGELPRPLDLLNIARQRLDLAAQHLGSSLRDLGQQKRLGFERVAARLSPNALRADLRHARAQLAPQAERLEPAYRRIVTRAADRLATAWKLVDSLSYKRIIERGFALVTDADTGEIVRSKDSARPGQLLVVDVSDGSFGVNVSGAPAQRKKARPPRDDGGQQSLF
ncbi:exodeoxyribonuclease VII large subunit [Devosia sp. 66-22]|uniref:exodeoxyribonuclease VII large subunit n=1 Tax=Devosia sp. 66-22 TaxID=1895753 RepID=UPI0009295CC1|nr:exodeoxyribonuclease VII large subunit [Devosia sp. 66-22]OJX51260.1 MAG: exodeoxyribonuclease VII large subunit [Devosia sp. 66-22]